MKDFGLQLYTIRDSLTSPEAVKDSFRRIVEMGYTVGQTATSTWYDMPVEDFAAICKETGLTICGSHYSFDAIRDETDRVMREHEIVGTTNIGIGGMPGLWQEELTLDYIKRFTDEFNTVARKVHKNGFKLTYHNHQLEFCKMENGQTIMDYLAENFDPDAVSFVLDTHWVQAGGGDVCWWLKKLAGRVDILHLKDFQILDGERAFAEVFEGNLNMDGIIRTAKEIGVKYYVVEQDSCPGDPFDSIRISAENLKTRA